MASSALLIKKSLKEPKSIRAKYYIMIGSTLIPFVVNVLKMYGVIVEPKFIDFTLISFSIFFIVLSISLNYYDFFEIMPYGYEFFDNLQEATLFIDGKNKIINYNHKIKQNFGAPANSDNIEQFLYKIGFINNDKATDFLRELENTTDYIKYTGFEYNKSLYYDILVSPIFDKSNNLVMKVMTFYDITEFYNLQKENYKKTKQIENTRIKSDMHDKIGNIIVLIKSSIEIILKEKLENSVIVSVKDDSEKKLAENIVKEKYEIDTRTIEKIKDVHDKSKEALEVLREICKKIEVNNYSKDNNRNIIVQLEEVFEKHEASGAIEKIHFTYEGDLNFNAQYTKELTMICTEALTNSIKHGEAKNVFFILKNDGSNISLRIIDDGKGCSVIKKLASIENRVANIKGKIQCHSDVNAGFYINIIFPYTQECYREVLVS
ncbi:MAG TPA: histidine kinase N-terminal 7TM domain-containing protein [Acetivibrio sp.]|nr:histidine kinase N-terminal 7TM domain-containing protein [Acetivibrio sp.]